MKKKIIFSIVGPGKVGVAVLERLIQLGFESETTALGRKVGKIETSYNKEVVVLGPEDYKFCIINNSFNADYIIVCTSGKVLEKNIDILLLAKKPLIILSTKYDNELIKQKCIDSNISAILSPNMALPILDFWKRLESLEKTHLIKIDEGVESHPGFKTDISASLVKTFEICNNLGIKSTFNHKKATNDYETYKSYENGCVKWIRDIDSQKEQYSDFLKEDYFEAHAYHKYVFEGNHTPAAKHYLYNMFSLLESLEDYSDEILDFSVSLSEDLNSLHIVHNINGRSIYGDGVSKAISFLENSDLGVYSGIDIIK